MPSSPLVPKQLALTMTPSRGSRPAAVLTFGSSVPSPVPFRAASSTASAGSEAFAFSYKTAAEPCVIVHVSVAADIGGSLASALTPLKANRFSLALAHGAVGASPAPRSSPHVFQSLRKEAHSNAARWAHPIAEELGEASTSTVPCLPSPSASLSRGLIYVLPHMGGGECPPMASSLGAPSNSASLTEQQHWNQSQGLGTRHVSGSTGTPLRLAAASVVRELDLVIDGMLRGRSRTQLQQQSLAMPAGAAAATLSSSSESQSRGALPARPSFISAAAAEPESLTLVSDGRALDNAAGSSFVDGDHDSLLRASPLGLDPHSAKSAAPGPAGLPSLELQQQLDQAPLSPPPFSIDAAAAEMDGRVVASDLMALVTEMLMPEASNVDPSAAVLSTSSPGPHHDISELETTPAHRSLEHQLQSEMSPQGRSLPSQLGAASPAPSSSNFESTASSSASLAASAASAKSTSAGTPQDVGSSPAFLHPNDAPAPESPSQGALAGVEPDDLPRSTQPCLDVDGQPLPPLSLSTGSWLASAVRQGVDGIRAWGGLPGLLPNGPFPDPATLTLIYQPLDMLSRGPKGNSVRLAHGAKASRGVRFAGQLNVACASARLSTVSICCDDTSRGVLLRVSPEPGLEGPQLVMGLPNALYALEPAGEWWLEYTILRPRALSRPVLDARVLAESQLAGRGAPSQQSSAAATGFSCEGGVASRGPGSQSEMRFEVRSIVARRACMLHELGL